MILIGIINALVIYYIDEAFLGGKTHLQSWRYDEDAILQV